MTITFVSSEVFIELNLLGGGGGELTLWLGGHKFEPHYPLAVGSRESDPLYPLLSSVNMCSWVGWPERGAGPIGSFFLPTPLGAQKKWSIYRLTLNQGDIWVLPLLGHPCQLRFQDY